MPQTSALMWSILFGGIGMGYLVYAPAIRDATPGGFDIIWMPR